MPLADFIGSEDLTPLENANEYNISWFGDVYIVDGGVDHFWMWSASHGWWAVYKASVVAGEDHFWMWDHQLEDWFFVDADLYPWVYAMNIGAEPHGWLFYVGGLVGERFFFVDSLQELLSETEIYSEE